MIALTLCLNYTYDELYSILMKLNISDFQNITTENIMNFFEEVLKAFKNKDFKLYYANLLTDSIIRKKINQS